ncbi:uncharacterized protein LOC143585102 [Bidens hawaiensis]|uniref:uncharacterized protein LOC143585102 n=1 Tax=Bidens hawaiensis TaxID=980011 RepID=UPI004049AEC0
MDNPQHHCQCRINELHGRRIRACFHGWVILSNHSDNVLWSLWNPLTSKLIPLPPLIYEEKRSHECCLSSPPGDQDSVFLLTTVNMSTIVFYRLDRKREKLKWTELSYAKQLPSISGIDRFLQCPTCYNGKVYAMTFGPYDMSVINVDILVKGKEDVISLLPFVELPSTCYNRCPYFNSAKYSHRFLKGSCTELFYIVVDFIIEKGIDYVYLFKLDITSMMWEEMIDLKDAILFLELSSDYSTCYYRSAVDSRFGGYAHILGESGEIIFSFHPKDRTMSVSSMPCLVRESQATAWAMIEWRLEVDHVECMLEAEGKDTQIVLRPIKGDDDFDGTTGESHLLNIPIHILDIIMELCIGIEYMTFRATSKHCYLAAPLIQWSTKTTLKRLHMYSLVSPWLMVLDNY